LHHRSRLVVRFELESREEDAASFSNLGNKTRDGQIRLDRKRAGPLKTLLTVDDGSSGIS
jgi:hypothetical protein